MCIPVKKIPIFLRFTLISEPGLVSFGFRLDPFCCWFSRASALRPSVRTVLVIAVLVVLVLLTVAAVLAVVGEVAVVVAVSGGNNRSSC